MEALMHFEDVSGSSWKLLFRIGAISAFGYVLMVFIPLVLLIAAPHAPLSGGAAILEFIAAHRGAYLAELICFVGLSLPAIAAFLALGAALAPSGKSLALLGAVIGAGSEFAALALGSSPPSLNGGLILLSDRYAAAGEVARASLATAAEALAAYANAISSVGILTALAILILSIQMTKGPFAKWFSILGIVTGALGILFEAFRDYIGAAYSLYGTLLPLWFFSVGLGLLRIARDGARSRAS
jgi:hypothetical protein